MWQDQGRKPSFFRQISCHGDVSMIFIVFAFPDHKWGNLFKGFSSRGAFFRGFLPNCHCEGFSKGFRMFCAPGAGTDHGFFIGMFSAAHAEGIRRLSSAEKPGIPIFSDVSTDFSAGFEIGHVRGIHKDFLSCKSEKGSGGMDPPETFSRAYQKPNEVAIFLRRWRKASVRMISFVPALRFL